MANTLGSVVIEMAVNLARLRSDFGQAAQISQTRLREIQRETQRTVQSLSGIGRTVGNVLGALGVGVGFTAIVAGLKSVAAEAISFGDEMAKAAAKTGVAASDFSQLAYAAKQNDVPLEALSVAFKKLQVNISEAGSGSKTAQASFRALGVEFESFRNLSPDKQFELLADQISKLKDPADRTRAAVELFGRSGADLLPLFEQGAKGIRALREEAIRTGRALTEDQISKLADADLAVKNLKAAWSSFARTLVAEVAPAITEVLNRLGGTTEKQIGTDLAIQLNKLGELQRKQRVYSQPGFDRRVLNDLNKQIQETQDKIGTLRSSLAALYDRKGPQRRRGGPAQENAPPGFEGAGGKDTAKAIKDEIDTSRAANIAFYEQQRALRAELEKTGRIGIEYWEDINFRTKLSTDLSKQSADALEGIAEQMEAQRDAVSKTASELSVFAEQAARNMQNAFADFFYDFDGGLKGMLGSFVDTVRRMVAELMAQQALMAFFSWGANKFAGSSLGNTFSSFVKGISGARAMGGPVSAGGAYLVGEKGPELFVPQSSGSIVPNGGGVAIQQNISIDARGADAERIQALMPAWGRAIQQQTISAVRELNKRGRLV